VTVIEGELPLRPIVGPHDKPRVGRAQERAHPERQANCNSENACRRGDGQGPLQVSRQAERGLRTHRRAAPEAVCISRRARAAAPAARLQRLKWGGGRVRFRRRATKRRSARRAEFAADIARSALRASANPAGRRVSFGRRHLPFLYRAIMDGLPNCYNSDSPLRVTKLTLPRSVIEVIATHHTKGTRRHGWAFM
jgi:hypothetical protein